MIPKLSIITPCYNSEATLEATLESVLNQDFQDWELIIVNDGSTDSTEEIALKYVLKDNRFKYYFKENGGLGKARNYGITRAEGEFILPLDSDNQLSKSFIRNAIKVFKNDLSIGVVYGYAEYFGEREGLWKVDDFNLHKMLVHNYIDACAVFKKELWKKAGGYDENMPYQGHEDWEFWIALSNVGAVFFNLHEITFKYYVSNKSMIRSFSDNMVFLNQDYIVKKHSKLFHSEYVNIISLIETQKKEQLLKLKSKKFVIDAFCNTFFGFTLFKNFKK
ncbi:glycosyltransferase [Flavobacterium sp. ACN6]|uniref:glycosyltransferase family 2 protein n=1 Tax=Flavobacterium sp. ACN6 TaxID=1920426 RepID=UPI000BB3C25D|nr:glycosyltransferase [Flavobacterium sp. ACN6]PBJ13853.1 putative glycosyltransferase EpsH [Flavobacterium sp. ACN6]